MNEDLIEILAMSVPRSHLADAMDVVETLARMIEDLTTDLEHAQPGSPTAEEGRAVLRAIQALRHWDVVLDGGPFPFPEELA